MCGRCLVPRYLWQFARPTCDSRNEAGNLSYHNPRTPAVSPTDPSGDTTRQRNVRSAGWDPQRDNSPARGRVCKLPRTAHHRLKPMNHNLTVDHVRKEARDLLRGLQRRDPEALRRCHAIEPLTDLSNPNLFYARFIIAREHGFNSWRKLKEHIKNLRR